MNPLALRLDNFRTYDHVEIDPLPVGCVAIIGPNGAGKSSLVDAIEIALFGTRSLDGYRSDTAAPDEALVIELTFEHGGHLYRVRRTKAAKGSEKLDFERSFASGYESLTRESKDATQQLLCATLGYTLCDRPADTRKRARAAFRASAFLAQGDGGASFADADPSDRKKVLGDVLGLQRYEQLRELARADVRRVEDSLRALDGRTETARTLIESKPALLREHEETVEEATMLADTVADQERERDALAVRYQEAREHAARRQACEAELATARAEMTRLDEIARRGGAASVLISEARVELQSLPEPAALDELRTREADLVRQFEAHTVAIQYARQCETEAATATRRRCELTTQGTAAKARADALTEQITHLEGGALDNCPTCKQALGVDARAATVATLTAQAVAAIDESSRLLQEADAVIVPDVPVVPAAPEGLDEVRAQIALAQSQQTKRATFEERIRQAHLVLDAQPADLTHLKAEAAFAVMDKESALAELGAAANISEIEADGRLASERLRAAQAMLEQARTLKARLDERLAQIAAAEALLTAAETERAALAGDLDVVANLERAFSPNGIPVLILEASAIPYLEVEAQKILQRLGGKTAGARIELRTQRELKSGDGLRDSLDIVVTTERGSEREYANWSGGEKTRIDLALRAALAQLLAHRRGADTAIFVIDEPEGLDATGKQALVEILRDMQAAGLEKTYLISHDSDLRDSFETTLTVVSDGERSRVDDGYTVEVAA